jgi:hypothetical protein
MRKFLAVPLAGALVLAFAGAAQAVKGCAAGSTACNVTSISFTPATTKGNQPLSGLSLTLGVDYVPTGTPPNTLVPDIAYQTAITLPFTYNAKGFFSCSPNDVSLFEATPPGTTPAKNCANAQVGTGSATAYGVRCGSHPARNTPGLPVLNLAITLFNGGTGHLSSFLQSTTPGFTGIKGAFDVVIAPTTGGATLTFSLPKPLVEGIPGTCSPISTTTLTFNKVPTYTKKAKTRSAKKKAKKAKKNFLKTAACTGGSWTSKHNVLFTDGSLDANGNLTNKQIDADTSTATTTCTA